MRLRRPTQQGRLMSWKPPRSVAMSRNWSRIYLYRDWTSRNLGISLSCVCFLSTLFKRTDETGPTRTIMTAVTNGRSPKYTTAHGHSQDSAIVKWTGWRALALVVAVGVALRLAAMWAIWANGGNPLIGDEGNYVLSALPLSEGRGIPDQWLWIRAPGFIFFAAGVFALTGGSLFALNVAQIALSGVTQVLAYFLGTFTTEDSATARRAGLWAAALVALDPFLVLSDSFFL